MPLRFPGQYFDAEAGVAYNYFRDYDQGTGRYTQADPIGLGGGRNRNLYAHANPIFNIDANGLVAFYNGSSRDVVVSGGTGVGSGHDGPSVQVVVSPGGRIDINNWGYDSHGGGPLTDVDSIDFNGDGIAEVPQGLKDHYPNGEKISGPDSNGVGVSVYDLPIGYPWMPPDSKFIYPIPDNLVNEHGAKMCVGKTATSP